VLPKIRVHPQPIEIMNIKKLLDGRNIGCPYYWFSSTPRLWLPLYNDQNQPRFHFKEC
jgi:hypothetical protein